MVGEVLRNIGKILFILFISVNLYAVEVKTELSNDSIYAGDSSRLNIMISGTTSDIKPLKVPGVKGLNILYTGSTRSFQFVNGDLWSGIILNFQITSDIPGVYKIPPFILQADGKRIQSRSISLKVLKGLNNNSRSTSSIIKSGVDLSHSSVYAGQPVIMRYFLYSSSEDDFSIEGMDKAPETKGFVVKPINEKISDSVETKSGIDYLKKHIATYCLIPTEAGDYTIGGGSAVITVEVQRSVFNVPTRKRISFAQKHIQIKGIPSKGKIDKFKGDVGEFKISMNLKKDQFQQFDEIRIPVNIIGKGNLLTLSKPLLEKTDVKAIIEGGESSLYIDKDKITGEKKFYLTLIPEKEGLLNLGSLTLSFYNPYSKKYERTSTEDISLKIQKSESVNDSSELDFSKDEKSVKYNLKIIFAVIVLIILIFIGIIWERRRLGRYEIDGENEGNKSNNVKDLSSSLNSKEKHIDETEKFLLTDESLEYIFKHSDIKNIVKGLEKYFKSIDLSSLSGEDQKKCNYYVNLINSVRYGGAQISLDELQEIKSWIYTI